MTNFTKLHSADDMEVLIDRLGFIPFSRSNIPGLSVAEHAAPDHWYDEGGDFAAWGWREEVMNKGRIAYGKLFGSNAGFIAPEWYPDFVNYRRNGYDFDSLFEEGLAPYRHKLIMDTLGAHDSLSSSEIKSMCGFGKDGVKGYDKAITVLQMQTYITIVRTEYKKDKHGKPYGWGVSRYAMPEKAYGYDFVRSGYAREPAESFRRIAAHIHALFPEAAAADIEKLIK